ncbi:MAG: SulP family inorganic anion transporter, partial [Bacteroidia bacterium]
IFAKQFHTALGVKPEAKEMLGVIAEIPHSLIHLNPEVTFIALVSLLILIGLPKIKNKYIKMIPAPLLVVLVAIPNRALFRFSSRAFVFISR